MRWIVLCLIAAGACSRAPVQSGAPGWTPAGEIVFYAENAGERADLFIMAADGSNVRQLTRTPKAAEGYPSASPDGKSIAYESDAAAGNFDIWLMNANGFNPRRITSDRARDVAPAWSPDGQSIVFMSDRDNREFDLYRMNADGTGVTRLTRGGTNWFPQFSPDGNNIALHVGRDVHVRAEGGALTRLTTDPANGMYPSWSPDGKQLVFMSWRSGKTEIFLMNADGSGQRVLASSPLGSAIDPRWSPDGKLIVFVESSQVSPVAPPPAKLESHISIVDVATGRVSRVR